MTALIDRAQTDLAEAFEALVHRIHGQQRHTLVESLHAVAQMAIAKQYANPVLASALDHEEARLPVQKQLRAAQERLVASLTQLLALHQAELAPHLPDSSPRDCFAITKALVEMEAGVLKKAAR